MALYVVMTEDCKSDARKHGRLELLSKIRDRVQKTQNLTGFEFFPPTFLKRNLGRNLRLIGYRAPVRGDELILFLRVFPRSSREYKYFLANWEHDPEAVVARFQPYSSEQLLQIHYDLTQSAPLPSPPEPSESERAWLYEVFSSEESDEDLIILETEAWVKKMRAPQNREFLVLYHQILERMELDRLWIAESNTDVRVLWGEDNRLGVVYLYRRDLNRLLLIEPLRRTDNIDAILEQHLGRLKRIGNGQPELDRVAARSYPFLMVLDQEAWLAIQKDEEANLALSPEEAELLDSIRRMGSMDQLGYPLFINGRAGSGKSTMLQYLAADYLEFALRRGVDHQLLYMTSSRDLLEHARKIVKSLLTAHHRRLLEGAPSPAEVDEALERSFKVFHDFLYSLLPPTVQEQLPGDRYVDYAQFRRLWAKEFARRLEARRISPDIAWHVIRSYIKGIRSSLDDELTPEEFSALPRRRRSVSYTTYEQIYEQVWCGWYKNLCNEKGFWDDQDLAAWVLELDCARHVDCAAIFCDEAQDFTPLELDVIFQFSLFGRRLLQPEELKRVPIVFAGDPLQTINPTGFRWDAVQADFYERFRAVLDPHRRAHVGITYKELSFNYRSNPGIVRFCNLIQLARAALLDVTGIRPQEPWWVDEPIQTVWFEVDSEVAKKGLRQRPDLVKLVNCESGEENDYVDRDEVLRTTQEKAEGVYRNVLSPMRAKGLEFSAVVLYRFGETVPRDFVKLLKGEISLEKPEEKLPYEYFFNRLYVAASRAKGRLVIVDSDRALREFWQFATDIEVVNRLMDKAGGPDKWRGYIAHPVPGAEQWWGGKEVDPRRQGEDYEREGRAKRDSYLLRQAALAYRSAGDEEAAGRCLAMARELEGDYIRAGDKYRELGLYEEAFRCYWKGQAWLQVIDLTAANPALSSRLESRASDFMVQKSALPQVFLSRLIEAAEDDAWLHRIRRDAVWHLVIQRVAERLQEAKGELPWIALWEMFKRFRRIGIHVDPGQLAMVAYRAGELTEAVELWEEVKSTKREEYLHAKAQITPFPENIIWFARLKEYREVLRQWRKNRANISNIAQLGVPIISTVVDAALQESEVPLAVEMVEYLPADRKRITEVLIKTVETGDSRLITRVCILATRMFVRTRDWHAAVAAAENADFSALQLNQDLSDKIRGILETSGGIKAVFRACVEALEEYVLNDREKIVEVLDEAVRAGSTNLITQVCVLATRGFVRNRKWYAVIAAAENADFSELRLRQDLLDKVQEILEASGGTKAVFRACIEALAISEDLPSEPTNYQTLVAEFLYRHFIGGKEGSLDLHELPAEVVGAAIERAGRIVYALQFYEDLLSSASAQEIQRFAAERLAKNLERYAEYYRRRAEPSRGKRNVEGERWYEEARQIREQFDLGDQEIPEYPAVYIGTPRSEPTEWVFGPLKIVWMQQRGRFRIEHPEQHESVSVYVDELDMRGEVRIVEVQRRESESKAWEIPDWNVRVALVQQGANRLIVIESDEGQIECAVGMAVEPEK